MVVSRDSHVSADVIFWIIYSDFVRLINFSFFFNSSHTFSCNDRRYQKLTGFLTCYISFMFNVFLCFNLFTYVRTQFPLNHVSTIDFDLKFVCKKALDIMEHVGYENKNRLIFYRKSCSYYLYPHWNYESERWTKLWWKYDESFLLVIFVEAFILCPRNFHLIIQCIFP